MGMLFSYHKLKSSPLLVRAVPFVVFAILTVLQGQFHGSAPYWIYAFKTAVAGCLLWTLRREIPEMNWKFSWGAILIGIAVFAAWVGLDGLYPMLRREGSFNPDRVFGRGSALSVTLIAIRMLGASLIVPMLEEVFYRSFLYRYIIHSQFWKIPLGSFDWRAFLITGAVFGISHYEWLPGILCAFGYQALVCRKKRLGDAISAHCITNFFLSLWVVFHGSYQFW
jgi:uncharacterized protein